MTKLKLLHVTPSYYPAHKFGGPIQSVLLLNRYLPNDIELTVYSTNAGLLDNPAIQANVENTVLGHPVHYFSFIGPDNYNFSPRLLWALLKTVRQFDLLHITAVWNFPVLAACMACWLFGKPYVLSPRGTIYPETVALKSAWTKKLYYQLFARWCLRFAKAIHYTSIDELQRVQNYLKLSNGVMIPNGIDLSAFQKSKLPAPEHKSASDYILFLGRLDPKKGLDLLLQAFQKIVSEVASDLVIAGPDALDYQAELQRQAAALGIAARVHFIGQVTGDTKLAWYQHAKLFVLPSYSENFGMTVVEAMASRCLVLISEGVAIYPIIQAADAGLVAPCEANAMAAQLRFALQNSAALQAKVLNAQRLLAEQFQIEPIAQQMAQCYRKLIA